MKGDDSTLITTIFFTSYLFTCIYKLMIVVCKSQIELLFEDSVFSGEESRVLLFLSHPWKPWDLLKARLMLCSQGVIRKMLDVQSRLWSSTHKKQLGICIEYTCISDLRLWLHRGKFGNVKWVRIPSLAAVQVAKYMKTVNQCAWTFKE